MACPQCFYTLFRIFYIFLFSVYFTTTDGAFSDQSAAILATKRMEKMTRLHFYFHDIIDGKNPSAVRIIRSPTPSSSLSGFGTTFMTDDPLTEGPEPNSKLVGRAQGLYAVASQHDVGLLMVMNFAFTGGMYNRSTLSILGRNLALETVREIPIVGGSGVFRFARGYALAKTVWYNSKTGNAVVEYNVSVFHF